MSNQIQTTGNKKLSEVDTMRIDLHKMMPQFQMVLPENVTPEKFLRVVLTAVQSTPAFLQCDRTSLYQAAMKCASDGLLPDGREAALIPYGKTVQYQPMVGGIYKNLKVCADLVYPGDDFNFGTSSQHGRYLEHKPKLANGRGRKDSLLAAFAITLAEPFDYEVMSLEEIEHVRDTAKSKNGPAWTEWYGEMAKKTVIKRLAKRLVKSEEAKKVIDSDNEDYELNARGKAIAVNTSKADDLSAKLAAGFDPEDIESFQNFEGNGEKKPEDARVVK